MAKKWMNPGGQSIVKHPGALHRTLGVPEGQPIPMAKIEAAEHSPNPLTRHRAFLAETFKHAHHPHPVHRHAHHPDHHAHRPG